MKNIYMITFHCAYNVGAMLQCYALSHEIMNSGFKLKVIDYRPKQVMNKNVEKIWNAGFIETLKIRAKNVIWYPYHVLISILKNDKKICVYGGNTAYRFYSFMREFFPLTDETLYSEEELSCFRDEDAVFITGSDQVWNFALSESPKAYLLDFVERGSKNSYAASFGKNAIDAKYVRFFENALKDFTAITVREKSGVGLVKEVAGMDAAWVVDPVFLLSKEKWKELAFRPKIRNPYIFLYRVEMNPAFIDKIWELKRKNPELKVVQFDHFSDGVEADYYCLQKGPIDFLSYLLYSSVVLTNSFHGTAFSIIAGKAAVVLPHSIYNERIDSLMNIVKSSCVDGAYSLDPECGALLQEHINYSKKALEAICRETTSR